MALIVSPAPQVASPRDPSAIARTAGGLSVDTIKKTAAPSTVQDVVSIINSVADALGVPRNLAQAIARRESGLNPYAVGDKGTSFGLFQLHRGGELGKLSPAQAFDAATNATVALTQVRAVMAKYQGQGLSGGEIAALAQRPADAAGYAAAINKDLGNSPALLLDTPAPSTSTVPSIAGTLGPPGQTFTPDATLAPGSTQGNSDLIKGILGPLAGALGGATTSKASGFAADPFGVKEVTRDAALMLGGVALIVLGLYLVVGDLRGASLAEAIRGVSNPVGSKLEDRRFAAAETSGRQNELAARRSGVLGETSGRRDTLGRREEPF